MTIVLRMVEKAGLEFIHRQSAYHAALVKSRVGSVSPENFASTLISLWKDSFVKRAFIKFVDA